MNIWAKNTFYADSKYAQNEFPKPSIVVVPSFFHSTGRRFESACIQRENDPIIFMSLQNKSYYGFKKNIASFCIQILLKLEPMSQINVREA